MDRHAKLGYVYRILQGSDSDIVVGIRRCHTFTRNKAKVYIIHNLNCLR